MHHQHAGPARRQDPRHHLGEVGEGAADQTRPRPGRIGERPKEIKDRRDPDLASHRGRVAVRRVEHRREAEPDPQLGDAACHLLGTQVDAHPERLQRVGAAGQRRRRPVAVLDHRHPGGGNHDRRHRGQVDRVDAVAAGTHDVDRVVGNPPGGHRAGVAQHDVGQLADLGRGGNLHRHRHREGGDLGRAGVTGHDPVHGPPGLAARQFPPASQATQDLRPRRRLPGSAPGPGGRRGFG